MATVKMLVLAQFIASKAGAAGLTVTCDVDEYNIDAATVNATFLTAESMTHVRNGIYRLFFDGDDAKLYAATAKTADSSVDQQNLAAVIVRLDRINDVDAAVSSRNAVAPLDATATQAAAAAALTAYDPATGAEVAALPDAILDDEEVSTGVTVRQSLAAAGAAADPLLNAVPGSYTSGSAGHALGRIASGLLTVVQAALADGFVRIVGGSTYKASIGTAIDISSDGGWPSLPVGVTIKWVFGDTELSGSRVDADTVRLELTAVQSAALLTAYSGRQTYDIVATWPAPGAEVFRLANEAPCLIE